MATKKKTSNKGTKTAAKKKAVKAPVKKKKRPVAKAAPKKRAAVKAKSAPKKKAKAAPKRAAPKKVAPKKAAPKKAAPKKAAPKMKAAPKKAAPKMKAAAKRRDGAGHLDPKYAADLRRRSRATGKENDRVFFRGSKSNDDLAEQLGEEFVGTATSGEAEGEDVLDQEVPEERGGPFIITSGGTEFADGVDASNPRGAEREPFPRT